MSSYTAELLWERGDADFPGKRYSRRHLVNFDGGARTLWSASPQHVPAPWSDAAGIDPEEAFIASLSSCHMLFFLALAAAAGFRVDRYADSPVGVMARNADGRLAITVVTLHPDVKFSGELLPSAEEIAHLHERAHEECYLANSVRAEVKVEPG